MRKSIFILFLSSIFLVSCKTKSGLVVTLNIEDKVDVDRVVLFVTQTPADTLDKKEIAGKRMVQLRYPLKSEGTYSIIVYTATDTFRMGHYYAEPGYRPIVELKDHRLTITKW